MTSGANGTSEPAGAQVLVRKVQDMKDDLMKQLKNAETERDVKEAELKTMEDIIRERNEDLDVERNNVQKQRDKVDSLNQQVKTLLAEGCPGPGADNPDAEDVDGVPWKVKYERERTQVLNLEAECNGYKKELQLRIGRVNSLEEKVQTLSEDKNELTIRWKRGERDLRDYKEAERMVATTCRGFFSAQGGFSPPIPGGQSHRDRNPFVSDQQYNEPVDRNERSRHPAPARGEDHSAIEQEDRREDLRKEELRREEQRRRDERERFDERERERADERQRAAEEREQRLQQQRREVDQHRRVHDQPPRGRTPPRADERSGRYQLEDEGRGSRRFELEDNDRERDARRVPPLRERDYRDEPAIGGASRGRTDDRGGPPLRSGGLRSPIVHGDHELVRGEGGRSSPPRRSPPGGGGRSPPRGGGWEDGGGGPPGRSSGDEAQRGFSTGGGHEIRGRQQHERRGSSPSLPERGLSSPRGGGGQPPRARSARRSESSEEIELPRLAPAGKEPDHFHKGKDKGGKGGKRSTNCVHGKFCQHFLRTWKCDFFHFGSDLDYMRAVSKGERHPSGEHIDYAQKTFPGQPIPVVKGMAPGGMGDGKGKGFFHDKGKGGPPHGGGPPGWVDHFKGGPGKGGPFPYDPPPQQHQVGGFGP